MTRKEQKIAALRDREIKIAASNYVEENSVNGYEAISSHRDSFIEGANWADEHPNLESLWHDASEEPEGTNWKILCQDENDGCWVENRIDAQLLHKDWNAYTEIEMVVRWAYIKDLLPKGGEK